MTKIGTFSLLALLAMLVALGGCSVPVTPGVAPAPDGSGTSLKTLDGGTVSTAELEALIAEAIEEPCVQELEVPAGDVTLHVRIAGDPQAGEVLIAINGGPGMPSDYVRSLEGLVGEELAVVNYDQRGTGRS
nr:hypothetical protein [Anaerolineae bacterium]NIN97622.1 hypothetical protein [Anaerolineae bacterium]NIQ80561.1 hypothetical protein [Anaerolineae bacterium]